MRSVGQWGRFDNIARLGLVRPAGGGAVVANNDIFGLGEDGAVTVAVNTPNFVGGDYTTFKVNAGVTVTAPANRPILIRATQSIEIDGTIDASGVIAAGFGNMPLVGSAIGQYGGPGGGGGGATAGAGQDGLSPANEVDIPSSFPFFLPSFLAIGYEPNVFGTPGSFGLGGAGGGANNGNPAIAPTTGALTGVALASFSDLERLRTGVAIETYVGGTYGAPGGPGGDGGSGAGSIAGGAGGSAGVGGHGGASIYLVAPSIVFGGASLLKSNGGNGAAGGNGGAGTGGSEGGQGGGGGGGGASGGQGGSGGIIGVYYGTSITGAPTTQVNPGAGGAAGTHGAGGAGSTAGNGGNGADGLAGLAGAAGFVFVRKIGHK